MKREEVLATLSELLETDSPLTGPERLSDLANWDSLAVMSFMGLADARFGVTCAPADINASKTVDDLMRLVCGATEY